jgi:hypothetical protein
MTARPEGHQAKPDAWDAARAAAPWALVRWLPGLRMATPLYFASRAEAEAARPPKPEPSAIVNILRRPARSALTPVSVDEILRRKVRPVMDVPYADYSNCGGNGKHPNHRAGLRPGRRPPGATHSHKQPPGGKVVPPPQNAAQAAIQADLPLAGAGTLTATARLVLPVLLYAHCRRGHRLSEGWYRDCRGFVCCLRCKELRRERNQRRRQGRP